MPTFFVPACFLRRQMLSIEPRGFVDSLVGAQLGAQLRRNWARKGGKKMNYDTGKA
jgi:hypothetical protein